MDELLEETEYPISPLYDGIPSDDEDYFTEPSSPKDSNELLLANEGITLQKEGMEEQQQLNKEALEQQQPEQSRVQEVSQELQSQEIVQELEPQEERRAQEESQRLQLQENPHKRRREKNSGVFFRRILYSHLGEQNSPSTIQITDVLAIMKKLYNLLKHQNRFERQILEIETEWYFENIYDEKNNEKDERIDWIMLNADLDEMKTQRILVENELAAKNIDDILRSSYKTLDHLRLKYMLDLVGSMEKRTDCTSQERQSFQSKIRRMKNQEENKLFAENTQYITTVRDKTNGIHKQPSECKNSSENSRSKRSKHGQSVASERHTSPPSKKSKIERVDSPLPESREKSMQEHKIGPYWSFVASIVQCLRSTPDIKDYLIDNRFFCRSKNKTHSLKRISVQRLIAIWENDTDASVTREESQIVKHYSLPLEPFQQRDAHEFLLVLLDSLHKDLAERNEITTATCMTTSQMEWRKDLDNRKSIISDLFYGQFKITFQCNTCGQQKIEYEIFKSITLPLNRSTSCDVNKRTEWFFSARQFFGSICSKCGVRREYTRRVKIMKLPPIMIIHLDRFNGDSETDKRNNAMATYPMKNFNLARYIVYGSDSGNRECDDYGYKLYAITCHGEVTAGGRYNAYCRNQKIWFKHENGKRSEGNPGRASNQKVSSYVFFYVRNSK